ncbi:unnamed protein product [Dovyalis caffra]|uniref:Fe2OG dioxygenase domain-containing protein n=1 Tax=Dovyalis caffra TaxID=77055 RepID=A0AAV1S8I0_9ROSI|nr:unnamed protein product [Dovyalis caffra]
MKLASKILELICEGLGLESGYFEGKLSESSLLAVNRYPPCPDPSLTLGLPKHCDPNLITILLQGEVRGLQVFKDGEWIGVGPVPQAFVINIGYQLQIISNNKLKGAEHRAVTNSRDARTSAAFFVSPRPDSIIEPAKALINADNHPVYRAFELTEFISNYMSTKGNSEASKNSRDFGMRNASKDKAIEILGKLVSFLRKCMINIISVGPMPNHIAFIMDGNRSYARKHNMGKLTGHKFGLLALFSCVKYGYELGVRYLTFYAFSIDSFKQNPDEVEPLMDLFLEYVQGFMKEETFVNRYGMRVFFKGDLKLCSEPVRLAAKKAMLATAQNSKIFLTICVAYSSTNEIVHAVQESCEEKWGEISLLNENGANFYSTNPVENEINGGESFVKITDIDKNMYTAIAPDPDILIHTSGETRLSNFLLWQTTYTYLYCGLRWYLVPKAIDRMHHYDDQVPNQCAIVGHMISPSTHKHDITV